MKNLLAIMFAGMSLIACSENASTTPSNVDASSVSAVAPAADTVVVSAPVASEPAVVSNQTASASK